MGCFVVVSYDRSHTKDFLAYFDPYTSHAQEFVFCGGARIILLVKINLLAIDPRKPQTRKERTALSPVVSCCCLTQRLAFFDNGLGLNAVPSSGSTESLERTSL
jgi:hypothetical protein